MRFSRFLLTTICTGMLSPAHAGESGLNTIPTTDIIHDHRIVLEVKNGNTGFQAPSFAQAPHPEFGSQIALSRRIEGGIDVFQPDSNGAPSYQASLNLKYRFRYENHAAPGVAVGVRSLGSLQSPEYYVTFSKRLNYLAVKHGQAAAETPPEAASAQDAAADLTTHHHTTEVFAQRLHGGVIFSGRHTYQPFVGADVALSGSLVVQSDYIAGPGNALTLGAEYTFPNHKTAISPSLIFSNSTHRVDGFFLSISDELKFMRH